MTAVEPYIARVCHCAARVTAITALVKSNAPFAADLPANWDAESYDEEGPAGVLPAGPDPNE